MNKIDKLESEYFYSEGYIYKGVDTYLEVIGTRKEQEELGGKVVKLLNSSDPKDLNWFEKLPLHWKLASHLIVGILVGLALAWIFWT